MRTRSMTGLIIVALMLTITTSGSAFDYKKFGPFVGTALKVGRGSLGDNVAYRAIIIRLNESGDACVAFDGDTMRMAGGWTEMYVEDAKLLADGKTVQLEIEDLQPVHEMKIQFNIKTKAGVAMKSTIWNTIHSVE